MLNQNVEPQKMLNQLVFDQCHRQFYGGYNQKRMLP